MDQDDAWRPSVKLAALLAGRTAWGDADDAVRSMARLPIHNAAVMIRDEPSRQRRAAMLAKIPAPIRPHVEARVIEIWDGRKKQLT